MNKPMLNAKLGNTQESAENIRNLTNKETMKPTFVYIKDDEVNFSLLKSSYPNANTAKIMGRRYIQTKLSSVIVNVMRDLSSYILSQIFIDDDFIFKMQSSIIEEINGHLDDMITAYIDTMIQYMYDQEYLKILPEDKTLSLNSSMMISEICSIIKVKIITMLKTSNPDVLLEWCIVNVSKAVHGVLRDFFC